MKRFLWVPCLVLAGLLALCLLNGAYIGRCTRGWAAQTEQASGLAQQQRWDEAARELDALRRDWQQRQGYLRLVLHRDSVDEVHTALLRCLTLCALRQEDEFFLELSELRSDLLQLPELERPLIFR